MPFETSAGLIARIFAVFRKDQKLADKARFRKFIQLPRSDAESMKSNFFDDFRIEIMFDN